MCYSLSMIPLQKVNLDSVITARLEAIGAVKTAPVVRSAINANLLKACTDLINEKITAEYVGDLTTQALKAAATTSATSTGAAL